MAFLEGIYMMAGIRVLEGIYVLKGIKFQFASQCLENTEFCGGARQRNI